MNPARRPRFKFTIGRLMIGIAAYALALAVLPRATIVGSILVVAPAGLIAAIASVTRTPPTRVGAWMFAAYPPIGLCSIYATWMLAWISLGHRPVFHRDDPQMISHLVSLCYMVSFVVVGFGWMPALVAWVAFVLAELARGSDRPGIGAIAGLGLLAWSGSFVILNLDPGGVFNWYAD